VKWLKVASSLSVLFCDMLTQLYVLSDIEWIVWEIISVEHKVFICITLQSVHVSWKECQKIFWKTYRILEKQWITGSVLDENKMKLAFF
jgi:hypothetical protein